MAQHGFQIKKEGDWQYSQFSGAPSVIIAERCFKWYKEQDLQEIEETLKEEGCHAYINMGDNVYARKRRQTCRLEIYRRCDTLDFEEQIADLQSIIEKIHYF